MARETLLTDEMVEAEIARLTKTEAVKLARREQRIKYRRRQQLYTLRALEKRGKQLFAALFQCSEGVKLLTPAVLDPLFTPGQLDGLRLRESGDLRLDHFVG